jgi:hypothetical protein
MKKIIFILTFLASFFSFSQSDEAMLKTFYDTSLTNGKSYEWLDYLSNQIGGRLSGSINAQRAVEYTKAELEQLGLDKVWLQPVMVPKWVRGTAEIAYVVGNKGDNTPLNICALGGSIATPPEGLRAGIVEVNGIDDLKNFTKADIEGKIVFLNRPMEPTFINTFEAYGQCGKERYFGAVEAAKLGAVGVLVRSLNLRIDDLPHTGSMSYRDAKDHEKIPAAAISTKDAEMLSTMLKLNPDMLVYFKQSCRQLPDVQSYNVIGEITGSEFPNEIMIVGGHLDSWDLGDGSHDDGAGVVQSMEVLRLLKKSGIKPKRTVRVVLFMNEENGLRGAKKYAEEAKRKGENHVFALESDAGGFTPRGFSFDTNEANFEQVLTWKKLFEPYLIHQFSRGGSGADVNPLKTETNVVCGLRPDSQRYFDHHHASNDTFDAINKRELELGAATMVSLVYLVDKYGVNPIPNQEQFKD